MKRLVGGDYLLDLSPIEIEESVDGETYTSITDKSVLDQLTGLKAFIGKSGMIKPIWVKLLNGETDEIVATRGSLSTSDGTTFLINILLVGFILTLSVEFTQMVNEDEDPIDDWYIDSGDAKYILVSEAQKIGDISELPVFENIVDKDGHKRFIEGDITLRDEVPSGFKKTYGKWSLSGTHLLIVLAGEVDNGTEFSAQTICDMNDIPSWIPEKVQLLRPNERVVDQYNLVLYGGSAQNVSVYLEKSSGSVLRLYLSSFTASSDKTFRINFDLLIDNGETETPAP